MSAARQTHLGGFQAAEVWRLSSVFSGIRFSPSFWLSKCYRIWSLAAFGLLFLFGGGGTLTEAFGVHLEVWAGAWY